MENNNETGKKDEFIRLRIDSIEKMRLEKLCDLTRRQKSDIIREALFELFKMKYPICLTD